MNVKWRGNQNEIRCLETSLFFDLLMRLANFKPDTFCFPSELD